MSLRTLFVEDSEPDTELQLRRLREAGLDIQWDRVQTEDALRAALADEEWDVALVDYSLPGFSGLEALRVIAELAPDLPAITVSGGIDEDTAVATISAGAVDYVLKDNLTRLGPAVRGAVDGAVLRRAHRRTAEAARLALFAVDHASLVIITISSDGTILYVNDFACQVSASTREDLVGAKIWDVEPSVKEATWSADWRAFVADGMIELRIDREGPVGERLVLDVTGDYLEHAGIAITFGRDITEGVVAQEQVLESEAQYRRMIELANEGVWAMDGEYRTTFVNEQMARMLGLRPEDMLGRPVMDFMFEEDLEDHEERMRDRSQGRSGSYERRFRRSDGMELWTIVAAVAQRDGDDEFTGSFGMFTDITERKAAEDEVRRQAEQLQRTVEGAVLAMSHVVETRDPYTAGHERRVAELAMAIGQEMGLRGEALESLRLAAMIHDIGKISVPSEILAKPGRLSEVEFNLIKQHVQAGYDILEVIDFGRPVAEIVLQHHERLDGTGYPGGLSGESLLTESRIIAVADVVEAMASHRPSRAALGMEAALAEIREGAGTRYDQAAAEACEHVVEESGFRFTP